MKKEIIPGLLVTVIIAAVAKFLAGSIHGVGAVSLAIILGIVAGNLYHFGGRFAAGVKFAEKNILTYAIVLMGFNLRLGELGQMGALVFMIVIPTMLVTFGSALLYGRFLGFSTSGSLLLGAGNAVCGSSAIAAVAPVTTATEEEIGVSIGVVNLLGTVGMLLLPLLAGLLSLSDLQSSYLIGGVLQAIGQVVAAGFSLSDKIGDTATLIKMLRVIMIGPIVMLITLLSRGGGSGGGGKKRYIPGYIIGFFVCSVLGSIFTGDTLVIPELRHLAKLLLMVAMAGVGMKIRFRSLLQHGPKALLFGALIALTQCGFILLLILTLLG